MALVVYEGQLMKKGKLNKAWKNRWCVFTDLNGERLLQYYDSKINNNLCGTIKLSDIYDIEIIKSPDYDLMFLNKIPINIRRNKNKTDLKWRFILVTSNRKYVFRAFDPINFLKWINIFNQFVYEGVLKEGWLQKKGEKNKGWKKRFFVLNKYKQMRYYQDAYKTNYSGIISLNDIISIKNGQIYSKEKRYTLELQTNKRVWILCANGAMQRRQWVEGINKSRTQNVLIQHRLLSDDLKDDNVDVFDVKDKVYHITSSADDGIFSEVEEWKCSICNTIYPSQWSKCPGCLGIGTHVQNISTS